MSDLEIQEIYIDNIYGVLIKPKTNKKVPIVIFSHELALTHKSGIYYGKFLAKNGYGFYTFDFVGGSKHSKSGNDMKNMSVVTEKDDLNKVINAIYNWDFVDKNNIILLGASQGGLVTLLSGYENQEKIKKMIFLYPGFSVPESIRNNFIKKENVPESFSLLGWFDAGRIYATDIFDLNPYDLMKKITMPILILHGLKDELVDPSFSIKAEKIFKNSKLVLLENDAHVFKGVERDKACREIFNFLETKD